MISDEFPIRRELVSNVVKLRFYLDGSFPAEIRGAVNWRQVPRATDDKAGPSSNNAPPEDFGQQS